MLNVIKYESYSLYLIYYISIGYHTWSLLHSMVAYYPDEPSYQQRKDMDNFFRLIGRLYPCETCARDFTMLYVISYALYFISSTITISLVNYILSSSIQIMFKYLLNSYIKYFLEVFIYKIKYYLYLENIFCIFIT